MSFTFNSFVDEFLSSQEFLFLSPELQEHGPGLLAAFAGAGFSPETFSIGDLENVLLTRMARLDVPLSVRRAVPELLRAFFGYLAQSGRFPPARAWAEWVTDIDKKYQAGFRDDGSVKGETFKKRYTDVNRNDPCPCGSGKKFKKCCMNIIS
jgi:SEC-C motif